VLVDQFKANRKRWAAQLTVVIRELAATGATLEDVRAAGRVVATWKRTRDLSWLSRPGELAALVADTRRGSGHADDLSGYERWDRPKSPPKSLPFEQELPGRRVLR